MSRWRFGLLLVLGTGCGRIGFDGATNRDASDARPDGGGDPDAAPVAFGPWSAPVFIASCQSADNDWEPVLDSTALVMVFSRYGAAGSDLLVATRASLTADFGAPTLIPGASNSVDSEYGPAFSHDESRLYFRFTGGPTDEARYLTYLGNGQFSATSQPATELPQQGYSWTFSRDGREVFYTVNTSQSTTVMHHAVRSGTSGAFLQDDTDLAALQTTENYGWPTLDPGQNTIYFERGPTAGNAIIYEATRPGPGAPFAAPTPVDYMRDDDGDPDISRDGRTLVFSSWRGSGSTELHLMTRDPR